MVEFKLTTTPTLGSIAFGEPNGSMFYAVRPHACASIIHTW
jgi:hypothetical protein